MTRTRMLTIAATSGALAGGAAAVVQASGEPVRPVVRAAALTAPPPAQVVPTGRLPDGRYDPSLGHLRIHRATLRIAARVKDPAGGPDWVLRSFDAERLSLRRAAATLRGARVVGRNRCVQVGRERGGRFGWVYGDGRFREVPGWEDQLTQCGSRRHPQIVLRHEEIVELRDPATPHATHDVLWGEAPGARSLALAGGERIRVGARGGFLVVAGKRAGLAGAVLVVDGRRRVSVGHAAGGDIKPGSERVEARAPDPAGGPPRGVLVAEDGEGRPCSAGDGQIVEGRVGGVDTRLGTFFAFTPGRSRGCEPFPRELPKRYACNINTGSGGEDFGGEDPLLRRARIERRLLPGRATVRAMCRPEVDRVTVRTPHDIRTLEPSPFAHVIFAIYDGDFPTGDLVFTAHRRDGTTSEVTLPLGI